MLSGMFKTFDELEENLNMEELQELAVAQHDREYRGYRQAAALKGIDLDEEAKRDKASSFNRVKLRAEAKLEGKDEETHLFEQFGVSVTKE